MTTAMHPTTDAPMTTPALAAACGVAEWQLRAAIRRGFIEAPAKVGPMRLWRAGDVGRVRRALVEAGYLPDPAAGAEGPGR